jgi:hypothetical protein
VDSSTMSPDASTVPRMWPLLTSLSAGASTSPGWWPRSTGGRPRRQDLGSLLDSTVRRAGGPKRVAAATPHIP